MSENKFRTIAMEQTNQYNLVQDVNQLQAQQSLFSTKEKSEPSKIDGGGLRYNTGKLPMELIPPSLLIALAEVLKKGAEKYEPRNWERGMDYSKCYACLLRHLLAWWGGEDLDKESGLHHLKHVACNTAFLLEYLESYPKGDDRPSKLKEK